MYISNIHKAPEAPNRINLVFFPPAGTLASSILRLFTQINFDSIALHVFDYPGRGVASGIPQKKQFNELCSLIHLFLQPLLNHPILLLGHSFGSYVALEVARLLQFRQKIIPQAILLSGVKNPNQLSSELFSSLLEEDDASLLHNIDLSIPKEYEEMRSSIIQWIREDLHLLTTYKPKACNYSSNLLILNGQDDIHTLKDNGSEHWQDMTTASCRYINLKTGHAFNEVYVEAISQYILHS